MILRLAARARNVLIACVSKTCQWTPTERINQRREKHHFRASANRALSPERVFTSALAAETTEFRRTEEILFQPIADRILSERLDRCTDDQKQSAAVILLSTISGLLYGQVLVSMSSEHSNFWCVHFIYRFFINRTCVWARRGCKLQNIRRANKMRNAWKWNFGQHFFLHLKSWR